MTAPAYLTRWRTIYQTANPVPGAPLDPVSRWMLITRACVFNMTLFSGLVGVMLAVQLGAGVVAPLDATLVVVGLLLAHAGNNMLNDYFDTLHGVDTADYPRANYAPHPLMHGLVSKPGLIAAIFTCYLANLMIAGWFAQKIGVIIWYFVLVGFAISVLYVAKPLRLKSLGLGEIGIFFVWGPLMVGGAFWALAGDVATEAQLWEAMLVSVPYGLTVMAVVMGKHMDKHDDDLRKRIHTLPVLLGLRGAAWLTQLLIWAFFPICFWLALAADAPLVGGGGHPFMALALLALPRAMLCVRMLGKPVPATPQEAFQLAFDAMPDNLKEGRTPDNPPEEYPIWPLWYVAWAFHFVKLGGLLFTLGLVLDTLWQRGALPF
ncbi:MAG: prenyltransferase [Candidatus Poseidoniia archaeon]|jgi:1,4-dihydroxy-2-naphthoate octaprenyltransferase|nr:prenyltransferase [Candidatus Poseidoniia archaeon]MDP6658944.1 prenyltransferase [Candidatus Poseidoniia archaeon]MDP6846584.1 prenyltransferase [Candidatus Poseidoniia archaeon]MDP7006728.1 prenyltransferase [Candidatus Poseidoniia archaeon]|tara:strand:+ start:1117 stop:2244 length:1128 start_codon:yes stop_codon:yes gene_type:complete